MSVRAFRVEFTRPAERQFRALSPEVQGRIAPKITALARSPRPRGVEKLEGAESTYRLRVGDYRVVYEIRNRVLLVLVVRVAQF